MRPSTERLIKEAPARNPDELLDVLQTVSLKHPERLKVMGITRVVPRRAYGYKRQIHRDLFFHPEFPAAEFLTQYNDLTAKLGTSALIELYRGTSYPFTLSEAMRSLHLTGDTRWPFDLFSNFGVRDGLFCTYRRWAVVYGVEHPLRLDRQSRHHLAMAGGVAVERLEQFVARRRKLTTPDIPELSDREKLVLRMIAEGRTADEIAGQLHIGSGSVRTYIRRMLEKLGARNSTHAVNIAWRLGLFDDWDWRIGQFDDWRRSFGG